MTTIQDLLSPEFLAQYHEVMARPDPAPLPVPRFKVGDRVLFATDPPNVDPFIVQKVSPHGRSFAYTLFDSSGFAGNATEGALVLATVNN